MALATFKGTNGQPVMLEKSLIVEVVAEGKGSKITMHSGTKHVVADEPKLVQAAINAKD